MDTIEPIIFRHFPLSIKFDIRPLLPRTQDISLLKKQWARKVSGVSRSPRETPEEETGSNKYWEHLSHIAQSSARHFVISVFHCCIYWFYNFTKSNSQHTLVENVLVKVYVPGATTQSRSPFQATELTTLTIARINFGSMVDQSSSNTLQFTGTELMSKVLISDKYSDLALTGACVKRNGKRGITKDDWLSCYTLQWNTSQVRTGIVNLSGEPIYAGEDVF